MKILYNNLFISALLVALMHVPLNAFEPEIKLAGRKDLVLSIETRQTVLKVGSELLATNTDDFLPLIKDLSDPFAFQELSPVAPVVKDAAAIKETPELAPVDYNHAEVLTLAAARFAGKVRGSIVRGDASFLQLEGGLLLKPGTSFPVRLPQAKEQAFTLTLTKITTEGYTLQVGEATKQLNFDDKSQSNSIQFTNPLVSP